MKMRKLGIALIFGTVVLTGCNNAAGNMLTTIASNESPTVINEKDVNINQSGDAEVYFCDVVSDNMSKYAELNTKDVAIANDGFGPMIVSPYASDDVVKAVTHVICDTGIDAYCYGAYLYDKYNDDFMGMDFEDVYTTIQARVSDAKLKADTFNNTLMESLQNDSEVNISPEGKYYYILDMNNFDASVTAIGESVKRQMDMFGYDLNFESEYYFVEDGRDFIGGYRGPQYSIYLDSYSPDNKIYEYYYWPAKNEWVDIYTDMYTLQVYDYTKIKEKCAETGGNIKRLNCTTNLYLNSKDSGKYVIDYSYRMYTEDFDTTEAISLAYEVYANVREKNAEYNTNKICEMSIGIDNFIDYGKEYRETYVTIPLDGEYTFEEFEKMISDGVEISIDEEPQ